MSEKEMEHMNSIYKKLKTIKFEIIIVSIALFVLTAGNISNSITGNHM